MEKIIIGIKDLCELCTFKYYDIEFIFKNNLQSRCKSCKEKHHIKEE